MHLHRSSALDGAATALTVTCTRVVAVPLGHGLGLIILRPAPEEGRSSRQRVRPWRARRDGASLRG